MQVVNHQHELDKLKSELDQHVEIITQLQTQISDEEQAVFDCLKREKQLLHQECVLET